MIEMVLMKLSDDDLMHHHLSMHHNRRIQHQHYPRIIIDRDEHMGADVPALQHPLCVVLLHIHQGDDCDDDGSDDDGDDANNYNNNEDVDSGIDDNNALDDDDYADDDALHVSRYNTCSRCFFRPTANTILLVRQ